MQDAMATGARRRPGNGVDYPVRFFNLLHFDRPTKHVDIQKWAIQFYHSSGLVKEVYEKRSRYPVTPAVCTGANAERWTKILNKDLRVQEQLVASNLSEFITGDGVIGVIPLFDRFLACDCGHSAHISKMKYKFAGFKFTGNCPSCKKHVNFFVDDRYRKEESQKFSEKVRIKVWPSNALHIDVNQITGDYRIYYKLKKDEVEAIKKGNKFFLETTPLDFIHAVRDHGDSAGIELDHKRNFWMKAESLEEAGSTGRGLPHFFSAWKTLWQIFIHRKAQESIVADHMLPYRVIYPTTQGGDANPFDVMDLGEWRQKTTTLINRWNNDPGEIGTVPFPIGYQQLGGNGKGLSLYQEIRQLNEEFLVETGNPPEFIYGGMNWSGSSVTLRMLENSLLYTVSKDNRALEFIVDCLSSHFDIAPPETVQMAPFRMADDVAKANMFLGLEAQGKISLQTALNVAGADLRVEEEAKLIVAEKEARVRALSAMQEAQAAAAAAGSAVSNKSQVIQSLESQELQQSLAGALQQPGLSDPATVWTIPGFERNILNMPEEQRQASLTNLQATNPEAYQRIVTTMYGSQQPLPEQQPPRATGVNQRI